jgi:hypothetical protein
VEETIVKTFGRFVGAHYGQFSNGMQGNFVHRKKIHGISLRLAQIRQLLIFY